jgi:hypothetical protein
MMIELRRFRSPRLFLTTDVFFSKLACLRPSASPLFSKCLVATLTLPLLSLAATYSSAQTPSVSAHSNVGSSKSWTTGNEKPDEVVPKDTAGIRLVKDHPIVYIGFEHTEKPEVPQSGKHVEDMWLRLYNNTKWSIRLQMRDRPSSKYGDVNLLYEVLAKNEVIVDARCHVCSVVNLLPGKSVRFRLPLEYLSDDRSIRISFAYEWEEGANQLNPVEPEHYVYFDSSSLPQEPFQALRLRH